MENFLGLFPKRNIFDLTHERKFSCSMGQLIPILCEEVLPGDTFKVNTDILIRFAPLVAPVMHRINVFTHFFFVPNRLIWDNWEKFITGDVEGNDATVAPYMVKTGTSQDKDLGDYFGLPVECGATDIKFSALPIRAYNLIYQEWFRDQTLQDASTVCPIDKGDGLDTTTGMTILYRNWEKDYFTSCLPWPQRSVNGASLPLAGTANVGAYNNLGGWVPLLSNRDVSPRQEVDLNSADANMPEDTQVVTDLGSSTSVTINALRQAIQIQKWLERNARAGVRYIEQLLAHWGILSSDRRLQRPEWLGGGRSPVIISETLQTSKTEVNAPQGNMAGHGYSAMRAHAFSKSFEEHGFVIGLLSVLPRTAYQRGLSRMWTRETKFDYFWPEFANLGEQAVLNRELFYKGVSGGNHYHADDLGVFGYQGRYDEYRRRESLVAGDFRDTLDHWHLGRQFESLPELDDTFISAASVSNRIFAVTTGNNLWVELLNNVIAIRPLPKTGEPGLLDHN